MIKPLTLIFTVLALLAGASSASAATFVVNDERDLPDLDTVAGNTPDVFCDVEDEGGANCTLRAAIQEANDTAEPDVIHFALPAGTTITAQTLLPHISKPTTVDGCSGSGAAGPCVGVRARTPGTGEPRLSYALSADFPNVSISGLAVTNAEQGIFVSNFAPGTVLRNNWIGLRLDGTPEGNGRGIQVTPDDVVIGGTTASDRNVISANGTGIKVYTGDNTQILGNHIGTIPNGGADAGNSIGIAVEGRGTLGGVERPQNTVIGGALSPAAQGTPECDGACNVISGGNGNGVGIHLGRDGENGSAASGVQIAGNYVGLNAHGFAALPATFGIEVGQADGVTIGGASFGERNVITGQQRGINAEDVGIADLAIRGNWIGTNQIGDFRVGALTNGSISVRSNPDDPATVANNLLAIGTFYGLRLAGRNANVSGNYIGIGPSGTEDIGNDGVATARGIHLHYNPDGMPVTSDNLITANTIGNAGLAGIHIQGSNNNRITENEIGTDGDGHAHPNGRYGVLLESTTASPIAGTQIGGTTLTSANLISNNPAAGIRIPSSTAVRNEIGQLSGAANGTSPATGRPGIIDLGQEGPGNGESGTHGGLEAPAIVAAARGAVVGTGVPGATIRLYEKSGLGGGEVSRLDLTGTVSPSGVFRLVYPEQQDLGQRVAATQTAEGGTSELSRAATTELGSGPATSPQTTVSGPVSTNDRTPSFDLGSDLAVAGYVCRLVVPGDTGSVFTPCSDPHVTRTLAEGAGYRLLVRAVSTRALVDNTAAEHVFEVDLTPPAAPVITAGPSGKTSDSTPTFRFTGDAGNGLRCSIDNGPRQPCNSGAYTPADPLSAGTHRFSVRQRDAAGNLSEPASRTFTVNG